MGIKLGIVATVRDVALKAGVSVGTVSNALNKPELVNEATVARVMDAVRELGFVRNDAARQLRLGQSRAIGMIALDMRNPFYSALALGAEDRAREAGYSIVLGNSDGKSDRQSAYLRLFEEQRLRGVLVSPIGEVETLLARLRERGATAILVDRKGTAAVSSVSVDEVAGGHLAGQHLVEGGRTHIAYLCGPLGFPQILDRLTGLQEVTQSHPEVTVEIFTASNMTIAEGRRCGELIAGRTQKRRPDAIFACNDLLALGAMQALLATRSIRIPDDIAIVGYDDIDFASAAAVPLTSVRKPAAQIGACAVDRLLLESEGAEPGVHEVFQPELVVRESSTTVRIS